MSEFAHMPLWTETLSLARPPRARPALGADDSYLLALLVLLGAKSKREDNSDEQANNSSNNPAA